MQEIIGLTKQELSSAFAEMGEKPFRAKQVWQWLYVQGVRTFDEMTNLSKDLRAKLAENFILSRPKIFVKMMI
jgi:23S rRNA (adenine2503-C2)-methyltransferase